MRTRAVSESPILRRLGLAMLLVFSQFLPLEAAVQPEPTHQTAAGKLPIVQIESTRSTTAEPRPEARVAPGEFTVRRIGGTDGPLNVFLEYSGSVTPGLDYEPLPSSIQIPAGESSVLIGVVAHTDGLPEPVETVIAAVVPPPGRPGPAAAYTIDPEHARAAVEITDADSPSEPGRPVIRIIASREITSEPLPTAFVAPGEFVVSRSGPVDEPLPIVIEYAGSAIPGLDYEQLPQRLEIPAGRADVSLLVLARSDDLDEGDEHVIARLVIPEESETDEPSYFVDPAYAEARVLIRDEDRPATPTLVIHAPEPGSIHPVGSTIEISAVAIDPLGYIGVVEFYSGETLLGVSRIDFIRAPDPGTPIEHVIEWKTTPGFHHLVARAQDASGRTVESEAVPIFVGEGPLQVVLAVAASDPEASEPREGRPADPGAFVVRRVAGPGEPAVPFAYELRGTARNGSDYEHLSGEGILPAGTESIEIPVHPLADSLREPDEQVIFTLLTLPCLQIFPPPPECYLIAGSGTATVSIRDSSEGITNSPRVTITHPSDGAVFTAGTPIPISVSAEDPDGEVIQIEVSVGGRKLTSSAGPSLHFEWQDAPVGRHRLSATATDDDQQKGLARPISIYVREPPQNGFVQRVLPPGYLPGTIIDVHLVVKPPCNAGAWAVGELPPSGWTVSQISDEGVLEAGSGKLKFGPFTDGKERNLSYRLAIPENAAGAYTFSGASFLDGEEIPIVGTTRLEPAEEFHPADINPRDSQISGPEVTAYAAAWQRGETWGEEGSSIPLSYVARAAYLWRSGEEYAFDPVAGAPPDCWVSTSTSEISPGTAPSNVSGTAFRNTASAWTPGQSNPIEIIIVPPPGTRAFTVEEQLPVGWRVQLAGTGEYDATANAVRWGPLYGDSPTILRLGVVPPSDCISNGQFSGRASFDGNDIVIANATGTNQQPINLRIRATRLGSAGRLALQVEAPPEQMFVIEGSFDLEFWEELALFHHTGAEIEVNDPAAIHGARQRFYRLRPIGR